MKLRAANPKQGAGRSSDVGISSVLIKVNNYKNYIKGAK